jgi:hypothetical protein
MIDDRSQRGQSRYVELLGQSLVDEDIRRRLINDPESLKDEFGLSPNELETLKTIDPKELENAASTIGGETTAEIKIVISGTFSKAP